jgi:tetratricopeptide (TPR) repeat protein
MDAFCRVRGFQTMAMFAQGGALESLFDLGEWDRVLRTAEEMLAWERDHGRTRVSVTALTYRGWVHLRRGGVAEAATTVAELLPLARAIGYAEYIAPPLVLAAECRLALGDLEGAVASVREFVDVTEGQEDYRTMFLPVVGRVLITAGALEDAERLVSDAGPPTSSRHRLAVISARAILAEARGDYEEALERYREAAVGWGEYRFGLECALVSIGAGRALLALGRDREAVPFLTEAGRLLEPMGASPFLEEASALLVRAADEVAPGAGRRADAPA